VPLALVAVPVWLVAWVARGTSPLASQPAFTPTTTVATAACPNCHRGVQPDWRNCPHCGQGLA
jgi:hypothetical protein